MEREFTNSSLLNQLDQVERLAKGSRLQRLFNNPFKYLSGLFYNKLLYRVAPIGWTLATQTFWKEVFFIRLPAGTDIYLTGGKSDDSEIRLCRYLVKTLQPGDVFFDIGAHYGFYSRLALKCMKDKGRVVAVEPSLNSLKILKKNLHSCPGAIILHQLVGSEQGVTEFAEFPLLYSEYNTIHPEQFMEERWYQNVKIEKHAIPVTTIDEIERRYGLHPSLIKIDAEGAESEVIMGAMNTLKKKTSIIAMEYLSAGRGNDSHKTAAAALKKEGYSAFIIDPSGDLFPCNDLETYMENNNLGSDNIIFKVTEVIPSR